jgi:hypothetical protein
VIHRTVRRRLYPKTLRCDPLLVEEVRGATRRGEPRSCQPSRQTSAPLSGRKRARPGAVVGRPHVFPVNARQPPGTVGHHWILGHTALTNVFAHGEDSSGVSGRWSLSAHASPTGWPTRAAQPGRGDQRQRRVSCPSHDPGGPIRPGHRPDQRRLGEGCPTGRRRRAGSVYTGPSWVLRRPVGLTKATACAPGGCPTSWAPVGWPPSPMSGVLESGHGWV